MTLRSDFYAVALHLNRNGAKMIKHILKDGTEVKDITGMKVKVRKERKCFTIQTIPTEILTGGRENRKEH